jgi:hypothetical protein
MLNVNRPYIVLIGVCIFTFLINNPFIHLVYLPSQIVLVQYGESRVIFSYFNAGRAPWSSLGEAGYFPMLFIYIFKNIVTFAFETVLNLYSLYLFQRHLARKARLIAAETSMIVRGQTMANNSVTIAPNQLTTKPSRRPGNSDAGGNSGKGSGGRNMANLVLVNSITSFIHNVITTYTLYYLNNPKPTLILRALQFMYYFATVVRHATNFFLFYFSTLILEERRSIFSERLVLLKISE